VTGRQLVARSPFGDTSIARLGTASPQEMPKDIAMTQQSTGTTRLLFPGLQPFYDSVTPYAYPLMRFAAGAVLVPHGCQKLLGLFGGNGLSATMAAFEKMGWGSSIGLLIAVLEFVGAIGVAIGLFTRFWAAAIAIEMAVITFGVHLPKGYFWGQGGIEFPLLWGVLMFAIALRGGGNLSVDHAIGREL
jgi:putative oxidoreductase